MDALWSAAAPYLRARKNDVHIPLSYGFAETLLESFPDADPEVVLPAILLHDTRPEPHERNQGNAGLHNEQRQQPDR